MSTRPSWWGLHAVLGHLWLSSLAYICLALCMGHTGRFCSIWIQLNVMHGFYTLIFDCSVSPLGLHNLESLVIYYAWYWLIPALAMAFSGRLQLHGTDGRWCIYASSSLLLPHHLHHPEICLGSDIDEDFSSDDIMLFVEVYFSIWFSPNFLEIFTNLRKWYIDVSNLMCLIKFSLTLASWRWTEICLSIFDNIRRCATSG